MCETRFGCAKKVVEGLLGGLPMSVPKVVCHCVCNADLLCVGVDTVVEPLHG
jgi:hypothetical protein